MHHVAYRWTGHHWGFHGRLPPAEADMEMLVWIQRVCFIRDMASGFKVIWAVGR